nr:MAG TPA: hypothetical protein [Caudoviricetes sp.]
MGLSVHCRCFLFSGLVRLLVLRLVVPVPLRRWWL